MSNPTPRRVALVLVGLALVACAESGDGPTVAETPATSQAAEAHPAGADLFQRNCAVCHGPLAQGGTAGPPLTDEVYADLTDDDIRTAVAEGVPQTNWDLGGMPARPGVSEADVDAIIPYLRELQREVGLID